MPIFYLATSAVAIVAAIQSAKASKRAWRVYPENKKKSMKDKRKHMAGNMKSNGRLFAASPTKTQKSEKNHIKSLKANFHMDKNCGGKKHISMENILPLRIDAIDFSIPTSTTIQLHAFRCHLSDLLNNSFKCIKPFNVFSFSSFYIHSRLIFPPDARLALTYQLQYP